MAPAFWDFKDLSLAWVLLSKEAEGYSSRGGIEMKTFRGFILSTFLLILGITVLGEASGATFEAIHAGQDLILSK